MINMTDAYQQAQEENNSYAPIPNGDYPIIVENAEYKQYKSGKWGVSVQLSIVNHQQFDNRKLFDNFVIFESDGQTEVIRQDNNGNNRNFGKINYAKLCEAAGLTPEQASDPTNLIQKMLVVKTKLADKNDGSGEKDAKPSYYKPMAGVGGSSQPLQQAAQQPAQQAQPVQGGFGGQASGFTQQNTNAFARK